MGAGDGGGERRADGAGQRWRRETQRGGPEMETRDSEGRARDGDERLRGAGQRWRRETGAGEEGAR